MSNYPNNILQQVQTYQRSSLALLQNLCCHVSTANTRFKDFNNISANLGSTVTFDLPPRGVVSQGLVASYQSAVQRVLSLTCDQASNASFAVTSQERIFNLEKGSDQYMDEFGRSFMAELATNVEASVAKNWDSSVYAIDQNGNASSIANTNSGPYRFYGNGSTALNSYQQLAQMIMLFKNYGAVSDGIKVYLPDVVVPSIVGSGLQQFAPRRNDDLANSWDIGNFGTPPVDYYQSNLLPLHVSGNTGVDADILTVVSVNDPSGQNVTRITVSGATASDAMAVFSGDLFQFQDGVSGYNNLRYLTFIGHKPSSNPVQVRVTADAASDASGNVTLSIFPALNWAGGQTQNLNTPIVAGMQLKGLPSHRAGGVCGGDSLFLAMPKLPDQFPFASASEYDETTGVSVRMTYGSILGQNQTGIIYDETHGSVLVPEYSMRIIVPLSQG